MLEYVRHHSVRKWKYIMRFEIRYFFLEIGLSPNFKPHYFLPIPNGMVAHALTYWPNVGAFGPLGPSHLTYPPLWKLQYTSAHTNVMHKSMVAPNLSIVAHTLTCLPNVGAFGPSVPQPPNLTSIWKLQYGIYTIYSKRTLLKGGPQ